MQDRRDIKRAMQEKADRRAGLSKKARRDEVKELTSATAFFPTGRNSHIPSKEKRAPATSSILKTTSNSHAGAETLPSSTRQAEHNKPDAKQQQQRTLTPKPKPSRVRRSPSLSPTPTTSSPTLSAEPECNVQEPSTSILNRLDTKLQQRHVTLLAQIDARRSRIMQEDDRRRATFQQAAAVLTKEIDSEERWLAELRQMMSQEFPPPSPPRRLDVVPLPSLPGLAGQPTSAVSHSSHAGHDNERERSYLSEVIRHQDKHIAALYYAHRMAVDGELADCRRVAEVLNQLEHHRQAIMFYRSLDAEPCDTAPK